MEGITETALSPESAPPPDVASAFEPTPGEQRTIDREYDGSYRAEHADAHSAARELVRKRKERETADAAVDRERTLIAEADIEPIGYQNRPDDKPLSTLEASKDLAAYRESKALEQQEKLKSLLTELTGEQPPTDAAPQPQQPEQPAPTEAPVQQSPEQQLAERINMAERSRAEYATLLHATALNVIGLAQENFGDLQTWQDVGKLRQADPARFERFRTAVGHIEAVKSEIGKIHQQQQLVNQHQFEQFARQHDAAAAQTIPELSPHAPPGARQALQKAVSEVMKGAGFSDQEMSDAYQGRTAVSLRDHRAQQILVAAAKWYAGQEKAKHAARRPVPPVMRPGVVGAVNRSEGELSGLKDRLNRTGHLKDAVALRLAQIQQRNRG
jgi:hypothetical protein